MSGVSLGAMRAHKGMARVCNSETKKPDPDPLLTMKMKIIIIKGSSFHEAVRMRRRILKLIPVFLLGCGSDPAETGDPLAGLTLVQEDPSDGPLAELDEAWMERFIDGDVAFEAIFREPQGLGPAYIRASCASCHADDARGPGVVIKMAVPSDPESEDTLLPFGHTERPYVGGGASTPITVPEDSRVLATTRSPPAVFGRGYLEAVSDETIRALAAAQAEEGLVSGRVNEVACEFEENPDSLFPACAPGETLVGRFGLKARIPTLDGFAADAYQGDMSITSPLRPLELANPDGLDDDLLVGVDIDLETVNLTADYMRLLAIPERATVDGADLFEDVGCGACHVAALPTRADWPVPQLAGVEAALYTDLLLHDMGEGFEDGLEDGLAGSSEWRTAPLMGLRFLTSLMHDGRALTVEEAILAHGADGSEAAFSVDEFLALSDDERETLITFVEAL